MNKKALLLISLKSALFSLHSLEAMEGTSLEISSICQTIQKDISENGSIQKERLKLVTQILCESLEINNSLKLLEKTNLNLKEQNETKQKQLFFSFCEKVIPEVEFSREIETTLLEELLYNKQNPQHVEDLPEDLIILKKQINLACSDDNQKKEALLSFMKSFTQLTQEKHMQCLLGEKQKELLLIQSQNNLLKGINSLMLSHFPNTEEKSYSRRELLESFASLCLVLNNNKDGSRESEKKEVSSTKVEHRDDLESNLLYALKSLLYSLNNNQEALHKKEEKKQSLMGNNEQVDLCSLQ